MDHQKLDDALRRINLHPERIEHPAVFSCDEALEKCPPMPGARTKQLLFTEKKGDRIFLAIVLHDKKVDMKRLAKDLDCKELTFADEDMMMRLLHVTPGSVTPLGLLFDEDHEIEILMDEDAWTIGIFQFHPLVNTATLLLSRNDLEKWLAYTEHDFRVLSIPNKHNIDKETR